MRTSITRLTQAADQAYEKFSSRIRELLQQQIEPFEIVHEHPWNSMGDQDSINCMRYFDKLLGCHAAEVNAPIPVGVINSVKDEKRPPRIRCEIFSHVDRKQLIEDAKVDRDPFQYVAHFGLQVIFDEATLRPIKYLSGISIDWAEIMFEYPLSWIEQRNLAREHALFWIQSERMQDCPPEGPNSLSVVAEFQKSFRAGALSNFVCHSCSQIMMRPAWGFELVISIEFRNYIFGLFG